jgi:hypothetical protein
LVWSAARTSASGGAPTPTWPTDTAPPRALPPLPSLPQHGLLVMDLSERELGSEEGIGSMAGLPEAAVRAQIRLQ